MTPFDEFGRRIYEMQSTEGPLSIVQGITQITPLYTKFKASWAARGRSCGTCGSPPAASPARRSSRILSTAVKPDDLEGRLQVVRLYLQSERYRDAGTELEQIIKDFPEREGPGAGHSAIAAARRRG